MVISAVAALWWAWLRANPLWALTLVLLAPGPLLAVWYGGGAAVTAVWERVRPATAVERCAAEVRAARAAPGATPVNYDREPYREMYWADVLSGCVRTRIEGR